jgi:hypothetical protein
VIVHNNLWGRVLVFLRVAASSNSPFEGASLCSLDSAMRGQPTPRNTHLNALPSFGKTNLPPSADESIPVAKTSSGQRSLRPRSGPTANKVERLVSDELPAVDAHRFSEAATAACGPTVAGQPL